MQRVVVTGCGLISPLGNTVKETWEAVKAGKCGIGPITRFDTSGYKCTLAAEVKNFDPTLYMSAKEASRMDLFTQYGVAASVEALEQSGLLSSDVDRYRVGVFVSSGIGGFETTVAETTKLLEKGPRRVSPLMVPMIISNILAGHIAIRYGLHGICQSIVTACATGTDSIGQAYRIIKNGYADAMVCGGAEATIIPIGIAGFSNMGALSSVTDPKRASIPFDKERSGFVMGEGAGILVLESLESAERRGAEILCELVGYGATCDAHHITAPDPEGASVVRCMQDALDDAGLKPEDLSYINAHGTGTPLNDSGECAAILKLFGGKCPVPVSSTKSMVGHMLGAAGAAEAIFCINAIRDGFIPATINLREQDDDCNLDVVPNVGRHTEVKTAMSNSLGFGGHNASLVLRKYPV